VRRLTSIALALYLAGTGSSLLGLSVAVAMYTLRQAARAAPLPLHPWGTVAGLIACPIGLLCWRSARRRLSALDDTSFRSWRLREL
jgi:hypothetical protein